VKPFRVLYLIPGIREPQVLTLLQDEEGTLPLLQSLVGGLIECVRIGHGFDAWINEEGRLLGLSSNRWNLVGPVVVCRSDDEGRTLPLDDLDVHRLRGLLARPGS
jgi:hypothetical protein